MILNLRGLFQGRYDDSLSGYDVGNMDIQLLRVTARYQAEMDLEPWSY